MKKLIAIVALALASTAQAQTPVTVTPVDEARTPTIFVGAGAGISPYATGQKYSGIGTLAIRIAGSNILSWSTLQMIPGQTTGATLRTGIGYVVRQQGRWGVTAIADAGVATGGTVTLGSFSGGGVVTYEVNQVQHLYITAGISIVAVTSSLVQPSFGIGFTKGF